MNIKAKEYRVCADFDSARFTEEVNRLLADGWELYGHFVFSANGHKDENGDYRLSPSYVQAMVRF